MKKEKEIKEEIKPFLEANKNLSKRIQQLEKENQELFWLRKKYKDSLRTIEVLENQLRKKNRVKVVGQEYGDRLDINPAWDATRGAIWDATRGATRDAVRDMDWDMDWDAAWNAARDAAWDVARSAIWDAARDMD